MIKRKSIVSREVFHERECIHRESGALGEYYSGESYIQALQLLRAKRAVGIASKVEPFFWMDAPRTRVWLCLECGVETGLRKRPEDEQNQRSFKAEEQRLKRYQVWSTIEEAYATFREREGTELEEPPQIRPRLTIHKASAR